MELRPRVQLHIARQSHLDPRERVGVACLGRLTLTLPGGWTMAGGRDAEELAQTWEGKDVEADEGRGRIAR